MSSLGVVHRRYGNHSYIIRQLFSIIRGPCITRTRSSRACKLVPRHPMAHIPSGEFAVGKVLARGCRYLFSLHLRRISPGFSHFLRNLQDDLASCSSACKRKSSKSAYEYTIFFFKGGFGSLHWVRTSSCRTRFRNHHVAHADCRGRTWESGMREYWVYMVKRTILCTRILWMIELARGNSRNLTSSHKTAAREQFTRSGNKLTCYAAQFNIAGSCSVGPGVDFNVPGKQVLMYTRTRSECRFKGYLAMWLNLHFCSQTVNMVIFCIPGINYLIDYLLIY